MSGFAVTPGENGRSPIVFAQGPPPGAWVSVSVVGGEEGVDERLVATAGALRCAYPVRVVAHHLEVDHAFRLLRGLGAVVHRRRRVGVRSA